MRHLAIASRRRKNVAWPKKDIFTINSHFAKKCDFAKKILKLGCHKFQSRMSPKNIPIEKALLVGSWTRLKKVEISDLDRFWLGTGYRENFRNWVPLLGFRGNFKRWVKISNDANPWPKVSACVNYETSGIQIMIEVRKIGIWFHFYISLFVICF